jgi:5'-nucleotidase
MRILLSNDDGYQAVGIRCLQQHLQQMACVTEVWVVAPDRDRSGASNSLTLDRPLSVKTESDGVLKINGTPTDCVHLAITGLMSESPDLVVSGINAGANLGDDVLYSGTVAAAMEGRFLGLPALAVSLAGEKLQYYQTAVQVAELLIKNLAQAQLPANTILNVNVPDVPYDQLHGMVITRLGHRHKAEPCIRATDPRGRLIYWIGAAGASCDDGQGTDFYAIMQNQVSITPLHTDLTHHRALALSNDWLQRFV